MHRLNVRSGFSLVELLVALVIGSMVLAMAYAGVLHFRTVTDALVRRDQGVRLSAEVTAILEAVGRGLRHPRILGDTALHGEWRIGVGVICLATSSSVVLSPAGLGLPDALTILAEAPAANDRLDLYLPSDSSDAGGWESFRVERVASLTAYEGCGFSSQYVAPPDRAHPVFRLSHMGTGRTPEAGTPAELYRELRLVAYRDATAEWMLGLRGCSGTICGPAQPIVGPIRSPREGGLTFHARPGVGSVTFAVRVPGVDRVFTGWVPDH